MDGRGGKGFHVVKTFFFLEIIPICCLTTNTFSLYFFIFWWFNWSLQGFFSKHMAMHGSCLSFQPFCTFLTISTDCCTDSYRFSCFTVISICLVFFKWKLHMNQKISAMNVYSSEGIAARRHEHVEIHLWTVCFGLGHSSKEAQWN